MNINSWYWQNQHDDYSLIGHEVLYLNIHLYKYIRRYGFTKNVMLQSYLEGSTNLWLISVDKHFVNDPGLSRSRTNQIPIGTEN